MLELRVSIDAKKLGQMRAAIAREYLRLNVGPDHAATVAFVAERLVEDDNTGPGRASRARRRGEVLVVVTVQSDATMLLVRDPAPTAPDLGDRRRELLEAYAVRWSTMCGGDGRTIWAEIARAPEPRADTAPADEAVRRTAARAGALPCAP